MNVNFPLAGEVPKKFQSPEYVDKTGIHAPRNVTVKSKKGVKNYDPLTGKKVK